MRYKVCTTKDLSATEIHKLCILTLRDNGCMQEDFITAIDENNPLPVVIAYENKEPIGWGLLSPYYYPGSYETIMIYVNRNFRRQGIGSKLVKKLKLINPNIHYGNCYSIGKAFYTKNQIKFWAD